MPSPRLPAGENLRQSSPPNSRRAGIRGPLRRHHRTATETCHRMIATVDFVPAE